MIYNRIGTITDWEYDSRVLWWLHHEKEDFPDIYRVSGEYLPSLDSIESEKYILFIKGSEQHNNFDYLYEQDHRLIAIIKNYPALKNVHSLGGRTWEMKNIAGVPFFPIENEDIRTINVPLGYCNGFVPCSMNRKNIYRFFSGSTSKMRENFLNIAKRAKEFDENDYLTTFKGFGGVYTHADKNHLSRDLYSKALGGCVFALCPPGSSPETYRLAEAALSGCLIIRGPLPDVDYYKELPAIAVRVMDASSVRDTDFPAPFLNRAEVLRESMESFLENQEEIRDFTTMWYNDWVEPSAVSKNIIEKLRRANVTEI